MLILLSALALAAADAPAADTSTAAQAPAPATSTELKPGERRVKMICKEVVKANSRFAKKQCFELEAYKRQQEIDRQAFDETQNRPMISTARSN